MTRSEMRNLVGDKLDNFEIKNGPLAGIMTEKRRDVFIEQVIDSIHRVQYIGRILSRDPSSERVNPKNQTMFDPLRGAVYYINQKDIDEACWLIFLFVFFGKSANGGWENIKNFYGKLGQDDLWSWSEVTGDPARVKSWLEANLTDLKNNGVPFGNHRKYTSITHLILAIESYMDWVLRSGGHQFLFEEAISNANGDEGKAFDILFNDMSCVYTFGRLAKFDFLTMLGKMKIVSISPDSPYIGNATGPKDGAKLLFGNPELTIKEIEEKYKLLDEYLGFGMQVLEDSICNWQKDPENYKMYRL